MRLDRRSTLYAVVTTVTDGVASEQLSTYRDPYYVGRESISTRSRFADARDNTLADVVLVARWVTGLKAGWKLDFEGTRYRIERVDEMQDRKAYVRLYLRASP